MKRSCYFKPITITSASLLALSFTPTLKSQSHEGGSRPNILFICIDDLRTELGCYSSPVKSPNLDRLAGEGTLFTRHYVSCPTSGASRASMLSGLYPREAIDANNSACDYRFAGKEEGQIPETFFHQLRRSGYYTVGIGKISHNENGMMVEDTTARQLPHSWDEMLFNAGRWGTGYDAFFGYGDGSSRRTRNFQVKPYECADLEHDTDLPDGLTAQLALEKLDELSQREQPFCLAVGLFKPHLPFVAPKRYWDLYSRDEIELSNYDIPLNTNGLGLGNSGEFNGRYLQGDEKLSLKVKASDDYARKLRHAYYACVSYVDAQVGLIVERLEELGLAENTIIVVWGDHGWNLGDMNIWGKHTTYEPSLRSTLIIKAPNKREGVVNERVVASVDIYPTLMELCNIETNYPLDGRSMAQLLDNPKDKRWQDIAYSYFGKSVTMRTPNYRITHYHTNEGGKTMLFRLRKDHFERENIAEQKPKIVEELLPALRSKNSYLPEF